MPSYTLIGERIKQILRENISIDAVLWNVLTATDTKGLSLSPCECVCVCVIALMLSSFYRIYMNGGIKRTDCKLSSVLWYTH